jgi:ISXO2-like transposase domain
MDGRAGRSEARIGAPWMAKADSRKTRREPGFSFALGLSSINAELLRGVLEANVSKSAHQMTGEHAGHTKVGREFASHSVTGRTRGEYVAGEFHSNTAESSFSVLKRGLVSTFHRIGEQHLQRSVTEFDFRWNNRKICDSDRAQSLLCQVGRRRFMYQVSDRCG